MLSYTVAAASTCAAVVACATWLHRSSRRPGSGGRPAAAPVAAAVAVNCAAALLFDRDTCYVTRGMVAFLLVWLANAKAIAFRCGRGPLASQPWTRSQFVALFALPLLPADPGGSPEAPRRLPGSSASGGLLARCAAKAVLTVAALAALAWGPPEALKEVLYVLAMYGWLGLLMDGVASLALVALGLRLQPTFRPPWQARSVSAFWGAHWNLAASSAVRCWVYEPVLEGRWVRQPGRQPGRQPREQRQRRGGREGGGRPPRAALALCAACLASGLVHEVIVWYITGTSVWGAWLAFFALQGPLILSERWLTDRVAQAGIKPPPALRTAATLAVLLALSRFLFFGPAERIPLLRQFVERMGRSIDALRAAAMRAGR